MGDINLPLDAVDRLIQQLFAASYKLCQSDFFKLGLNMKQANPKASAQKTGKATFTVTPCLSLIVLSVCVAASAQTPQNFGEIKATIDMCATAAFRKNNAKVCDELELLSKLQPSVRGSVPLGSVPTTSPNYGKATGK